MAKFRSQNLPNLIRLAVLYKYGGIYLDTGFVVLKSLAGLRNAIGAQSIGMSRNRTGLNKAVLVFYMNHPLLFKFIEEFSLTFDRNKWGHNGPYLVSRAVQKVAERPGFNLTILPPMAFYPDDWNRIGVFSRNQKAMRNQIQLLKRIYEWRGIKFLQSDSCTRTESSVTVSTKILPLFIDESTRCLKVPYFFLEVFVSLFVDFTTCT